MNAPIPHCSAAAAEFLRREQRSFIDGRPADSRSDREIDVFDPGLGTVLTRVPHSGQADVDDAVRAARRAFEAPAWRRMKPNDRGKLLWRIADLIEERAELFAEIESLNNGMPVHLARTGHVASTVDMLRYMAGWPTKLTGETLPVSSPGEWHAFTLREPVGVVGQIVPWNAPLLMAIWKIAPALAAGCTVVLKPAEQTPLTALLLAEVCSEAGVPPGVVNIVTGDGETGAAIAAHRGIDKVAFTGSTEVGRLIVKAAADSNLKRVSLELGGKSPVIVFGDADLELAIPGVAAGIYTNAGQVCSAGSRVYAHRSVFDRLVDGVAAAAEKIRPGYGLTPGSDMGPLISAEQLDRVSAMTAHGVEEGAQVVTGGSRVGDSGYFFKPTVLVGLNSQMMVVREEIFGPVLSVLRYEDDDLDALAAQANDSTYGLAASIWTRNFSIAHKMAARVRAGSIGINRHSIGDSSLPFGGFRQSGWGRERGREALDLYTEVKSVAGPL